MNYKVLKKLYHENITQMIKGVVVERITEAKKAFKAARNRRKRLKNGQFRARFGL